MNYLNTPAFRQQLSQLLLTGPGASLVSYLANQVITDLADAGLAPGPLVTSNGQSSLHESLVCQAPLLTDEAGPARWTLQAYCWGIPVSMKGGADDCLMLEVGLRLLGRNRPAGTSTLGETVVLHKKLMSDDVGMAEMLLKIAAALESCWVNRENYRLDGNGLAAELTEHIAP